MDRKRIARRAYNNAVDLACSSLTGIARQEKLRKLSDAYSRRKSQLELASFLGFHGLDRILYQLHREHEAGRVGNTMIAVKEVV